MKHIFVVGLLSLSIQAGAQSFETTMNESGVDFNHYSIENSGGDFVLAGTKFNPGPNNDIHIVKLDGAGNLIWEKFIDITKDDRALDVTVDNQQNIVVCGYVNSGSIARPYAVKVDPSGNFLGDVTITGNMSSYNGAGTNVIFSQTKQAYIVGGFYASNFVAPLINNDAFVCEIPFNFNTGITWCTTFTGTQKKNCSINDIVEIPNKGYFVTGSFDRTLFGGNAGTAVLAYFTDFNGNPIYDLSFNSSNSTHQGVSAVYIPADDDIYLMSNNSGFHNPQITLIEEVSGPTPNILTNYYLELDPTYGQMNAAGFQLRHSATDPNNLVAAGYFRNYPIIYDPTMSTWISEFEKTSGTNIETWVRPPSAPGFQSQGGQLFAAFYGQFPYIYDPEILSYRKDGLGYCFLGPTTFTAGSTNFSMQIESTTLPPSGNCLNPYPMTPLPLTHTPELPIAKAGRATLNKLGAPVKPETTKYDHTCVLLKPAPTGLDKAGTTGSDMAVYPNPTTGILNVDLPGGNATRVNLTVYDLMGRKVLSQEHKVSTGNASLQVDMTTLSKGLYMLMASDDLGGVYQTIKIEKQ